MDTPQVEEVQEAERDQETEQRGEKATRKHIRGSSLLLAGRLVMLALNFGVQVLTVRYLAKSDYGAFSFAMSVVAVSAVVAQFGLDKAVARFVSIYHEQHDYARMFGTILMTLGVILGIGALVMVGVFGFHDQIQTLFKTDPLSISLLLIVAAIGPIQALESYFQDMLAVFASVRSLFLRRFLLGPALKLIAVVGVVLLHGDVRMLAFGYLAGSLIGIVIYVMLIINVMRVRGLLQQFHPRQIIYPAREVFSFSIPLLSTDLLNVVTGSAVLLVLEFFRSSTEVAEFRAIVPVAGMNLVVMQSFRLLFTSMASRLYAHDDHQGINTLYWKTATWIALMSFPVFVVTFSLAQPVTILLFGERYAQSGVLLALLSLGNFFNAALGFNSFTLRVYGRVKNIVFNDLLSIGINLVLMVILVPRYGTLGAAIGTCVTMIIYNLLNQVSMMKTTGIDLFERQYWFMYISIVGAALALVAFQSLTHSSILISLPVAALVSVVLLRLNRKILDVKNTFPELLRLPLLRPILGT